MGHAGGTLARRRWRAWVAAVVVVPLLLGLAAADAKVFLAKDEALALAFPDAERIESTVFFVTDAQKAEIERRARAPLESKLWTIYVGRRGEMVLGYAVLDSHVVRTLPETFMVVLEPDGRVRRVEVLAFYEPTEYLPPERWIAQFEGRAPEDRLDVGSGIQGITGATLSAQAMTAGVRRARALVAVLMRRAAAGGR